VNRNRVRPRQVQQQARHSDKDRHKSLSNCSFFLSSRKQTIMPLTGSAILGLAHLLGGAKGARVVEQLRPALLTSYRPTTATIALPEGAVAASSLTTHAGDLPLVLKHGDDLWRIRQNLLKQCADRELHVPQAVRDLSKEEFTRQYRYETRGANVAPDFWQALHLYAETAPRAEASWEMPLPPPSIPAASEADEEVSVPNNDDDLALVDRICIQTRAKQAIPHGCLIVVFKNDKILPSSIASLQSYMQYYGMKWVELYFHSKPGKTLREEISRRFAGIRVQQFVLDQRRHQGIRNNCMAPATVTALKPTERTALLTKVKKKAVQFPGSKLVTPQVDKSDSSDAYYGHQNQCLVHYTSRYSSEEYYRCVGNRK
jgi:hypothetical protein